jgi:hypothetical protein
MSTLRKINTARSSLLESLDFCNDLIISLEKKRQSDGSKAVVEHYKMMHQKISELLIKLSELETSALQGETQLLANKELLIKLYKIKGGIEPKSFVVDTDYTTQQLNEIWNAMATPDPVEYKLWVCRLEPQMIDGKQASGFIKSYSAAATNIPEMIEKVQQEFGSGKYQVRIIDALGKTAKTKMFEIGDGKPILSAN